MCTWTVLNCTLCLEYGSQAFNSRSSGGCYLKLYVACWRPLRWHWECFKSCLACPWLLYPLLHTNTPGEVELGGNRFLQAGFCSVMCEVRRGPGRLVLITAAELKHPIACINVFDALCPYHAADFWSFIIASSSRGRSKPSSPGLDPGKEAKRSGHTMWERRGRKSLSKFLKERKKKESE